MLADLCLWWCDATQLNRAAWLYSANNFNFDLYWIPRDTFNFVWLLNGGTIGDHEYRFFLSYYGYTEGTVEEIPEEPIEVFFVDPLLMFQLLDFQLDTGAGCPSPGDITAFPEVGYSPCGE